MIFVTLIVFCPATAEAAEEDIVILNIDGPIVPVVERYVNRGLSQAEKMNARACVIALNTSGGLYSTTQGIVQEIMNSNVPVIVYVSPSGGWAGSAGTFITISAHVAAMAPGSRIGAAHPVGSGGQELSPVQNKKITEDAAAWARSIAQTRNRNVEKAALAVNESKSFTAREALDDNLIDLYVRDLKTLVTEVHGRQVTLGNGENLLLKTAGAGLLQVEMTFKEKFLFKVSNPNLMYLLLILGILGLVLEFSNPGLFFPGIIGGISLLLSLYSVGTLNASWSGVLLIMLAFGLFLAEIFLTSFGILTIGGIASLFFGSMFLFGQNALGMQVSFGLIAVVVLCVTAIMLFVVYAVIKAHRNRVATGWESFEGSKVTTLTKLDPKGKVLFFGERWNAVSEENVLEPGIEAIIIRVEGLTLYVKKKNE
ncbi:MAG: nodulation protein NfeD [Clostridiales bacterium]|nr:nodulation protein NfeD [Clostridiales bacterium]